MSNLPNEEGSLFRIRHSLSHVMAQVVLELFPTAKTAIEPATEDGFYYDFDLPRPLQEDDLLKIVARMREIVKGKLNYIRRELSVNKARCLFAEQAYKLDMISDLEQNTALGQLTLTT